MENKKILYIVTHDLYFVSHRLPLARAAQQNGFEVYVATQVTSYRSLIESEGFHLLDLHYERKGFNLLGELKLLFKLGQFIRKIQPDVVHMIALRMAVWGGLVAWLMKVPRRVYTITGMGHLFIANTVSARVIRGLLGQYLKFIFRHKSTRIIVQNPEDQSYFKKLAKIEKIVLIPGSGVDIQTYLPKSNIRENKPLSIVLAARVIREKGVEEFIQAARQLKERGVMCRMILVGDLYPENPSSLTESELNSFVEQNIVEWWGFREDMRAVWKQTDIAVLPSYREGLPKTLLEAAACGLPIVTTDVPGCREVVQEGVNGFLVPVKTVEPLAKAIQTLIENPDLRQQFGQKGRERVEKYFSLDMINQESVTLYKALLNARG